MNGKQKKNIDRWCKASFEATPIEQRGDLTLETYIKKIKSIWSSDAKFREFMDMSMKQHYLK